VALDDLAAAEVARQLSEATSARATAEAAANLATSELAVMTADRNESTKKLGSYMNKVP
jgi:hypothetical protein